MSDLHPFKFCAEDNSYMTPPHKEPLHSIYADVEREIKKAETRWGPISTAHEGYSILLEEVDEFWDHVKMQQKDRDLKKMRDELIQVAAVAIRVAHSVCNEINGRK